MENSGRCEEKEKQQVQTSPKSSSNSNSNNGVRGGGSLVPSMKAKTIARSEVTNNPCPTTFIQADTSSFKQVVQMLTGSTESKSKKLSSTPESQHQPRAVPAPGPKKPAFKLYERRHNSLKKISPLVLGLLNPNHNSTSFSPRYMAENLSPSILDLPSLVLSPVTPLSHDPFNRNSSSLSLSSTCLSAEDRAIADKGYYLHPSTPKDSDPPRLLPLFPVNTHPCPWEKQVNNTS